ncbi:MAG: toll/interleukin-1 receptor domain-containing protein [Candidatus Aminicenantes bacterium]
MKKIFISYSHQDEEWKKRLAKHLRVLELEGCYQVWDDRKIKPSSDWQPEIEKALDTAGTAILLVSADFLISDFIRKKEIPRLLERREKEGLKVIPLIVRPCSWQKVPWLGKIQAFPEDGVPLSSGTDSESEEKLTALVEMVVDFIKDSITENSSLPIERHLKKTILITSLPQRKIALIGREEDLQMLDERIKETDRLLLVNGLGGIGKTEVCKRFFMEHYKEFAFAGWINYISSIKESMVNNINTKMIKVSEKDTLDERFNKIMDFMKNLEGDVLLVIDNIEDPEDEHLDTLTALPVNFKVIANSRLHIEGVEVYTLDFLTPDCCKTLFYHYYKGEREDEFVEKIVERCGLHTLTVELLARTAYNAAMPIKTLYETLEGKGFNLNDVIGDKVHTFWRNEKKRKRFFDHLLKIFPLSEVTGAELNILVNLSVLPAIYIPITDFSEWMKLEDKEAINTLVRKGWLRKDRYNIFMHQVIQEVIRYKTKPDAEKCENLIISLAWKLDLEPGDNPINKKEFVIFADSLVQHIDENDEELAKLANNLGEIFRHMGQLEQALEFLKKAMEIREILLDKQHPDLAESYNNLSLIYRDSGQLEQALKFLKKAIKILKKAQGKDRSYLGFAYNNLSLIYQDLSQLEQALEFQKKAIKICEKNLDKYHPHLASFYNNLSTIYKDLVQLEPALEFQKKAVKICEKTLDKYHPNLARSYNNLSTIYKDLGQLEQAFEFQKKALDIRENVLDKQHPDLATSYHNLSTIYFAMEDYGSAKNYAEQAVTIFQNLFSKGHPNLDKAKKNLEEIKRQMDQ